MDSVNSDEEDDLDNMICDSDTEFECVDASAVELEIADLSVNKFKENRMEDEDEYCLEAVVKKPRLEIPEPTSSSNSTIIRGQMCTQRTGHFLYRNCPKEEEGTS